MISPAFAPFLAPQAWCEWAKHSSQNYLYGEPPTPSYTVGVKSNEEYVQRNIGDFEVHWIYSQSPYKHEYNGLVCMRLVVTTFNFRLMGDITQTTFFSFV